MTDLFRMQNGEGKQRLHNTRLPSCAQFDPVELAKELRTHFGKILSELDHLVDVLAVAKERRKRPVKASSDFG